MFNSRSTLLATAVAALVLAPAACADPLNNPLIEAGPLPLTATPVPLRLDNPALEQAGRLVYAGGVALQGQGVGLGGLSAFTVGGDGETFLAMSDIGYWVAGRLRFDDRGRLVGATAARADVLLDEAGRPVNRSLRDAEAMVADGPGAFVIAFEREHRLWRYATDGSGGLAGLPTPVSAPPGLMAADRNEGVEALARLPDGRWIAIAQGLRTADGHQGWIGTGDTPAIAWQPFRYATPDGFDASDAAAMPNGDLLVVERAFSVLGGFRTRLVQVPARFLVPGTVVAGDLLASLERPMTVDNFEAVALTALPSGALRILLVSDDNFRPFQRTLLLAFTLNDF